MLRQNKRLTEKQIDQLGADIVKSYAPDAETIAQVTASPFLFSRIKANIAAETRAREESGSVWLSLFNGLRLALPAFALLAVFALGGAFLLGNQTATAPSANNAAASNNSLDSLLYDNNEDLFSLEYGPTEVKH